MDKIKQWFIAHSITTHSIAAGIAVIVGAYTQVPQFHDYVNNIYTSLPKGTHELVATIIALATFYYGGKKQNNNTEGAK